MKRDVSMNNHGGKHSPELDRTLDKLRLNVVVVRQNYRCHLPVLSGTTKNELNHPPTKSS